MTRVLYDKEEIVGQRTVGNYCRKFRGYIGECPTDFQQLAKVKWTFANTSDSRLEQSLYYWKALNHSTMDQKLLCIRPSSKSPYHISISPVLIIKNVVEFRQILANVNLTFANWQVPQECIGEVPATRNCFVFVGL